MEEGRSQGCWWVGQGLPKKLGDRQGPEVAYADGGPALKSSFGRGKTVPNSTSTTVRPSFRGRRCVLVLFCCPFWQWPNAQKLTCQACDRSGQYVGGVRDNIYSQLCIWYIGIFGVWAATLGRGRRGVSTEYSVQSSHAAMPAHRQTLSLTVEDCSGRPSSGSGNLFIC